MRIPVPGLALAATVLLALPVVASAQLDSDGQHCVTLLVKDASKVASTQAKRVSSCFKNVQKGTETDLAACIAADPDGKLAKAVEKGNADARKWCGVHPPEFGLPASFDDVASEAGIVHSSGVLTDLLGATPAAASGADGDCQAGALKLVQGLMSSYTKAFAKCEAGELKALVTTPGQLLTCLNPDVVKAEFKLTDGIPKSCEGATPAVALPGVCSGETVATLGECLKVHARCRACRQASTFSALDSDCDMVDDNVDNDSCSFPVTVSGNAIHFSNGSRVAGAAVWVLEHPEMTTMTDSEGYFEFNGLQEGEETTLVFEHPDFHPLQNGTIRLGAAGASRVTFQCVTTQVYNDLAAFLGLVPDELNKCQMVTTVTRVGKSLYDPGAHGEDGATVTTSPALPAENGPIYFNSMVIPQTNLVQTSDDGGVLYVQVTPGEYVWTAHKSDKVFTRIKTKCRAGLLVDASPPWGLQRH